jgi:hypothetical protein
LGLSGRKIHACYQDFDSFGPLQGVECLNRIGEDGHFIPGLPKSGSGFVCKPRFVVNEHDLRWHVFTSGRDCGDNAAANRILRSSF